MQLQKISQTIERGQAIKEQLLASQSGLKNTTLGKNQILLKKRFNDINMNRIRKDKRSSDKIIRGRIKSKNSQGKHQETDSRFSRLVNFQRAVGIRRSELKKLKGKDIRKDNNGNYYVLVQRGKGGKFQPQLILPQDVPVVLDTFKNKQEDDYIFTDVEMNNLINLHGMRAQHARECYYFYLKKLQDNPNFKVNLKNFLIERWEVGHQNLRDKSLKK